MTTKWCSCLWTELYERQCKIKLSQKILPLYKIIYNSENVRDSFLQWLRSSFLDLYILFCNKKVGSLAWVSLLFSPPWRATNFSQNCRPCSFCNHKQRCLTVLSELWSKVAFNSNTFFLNWKQWTAVKAVEDLQYVKMYVAGVSAKTAKGIFKEHSFNSGARFGAIYSASKTKRYFLKNSTIGNRLLF